MGGRGPGGGLQGARSSHAGVVQETSAGSVAAPIAALRGPITPLEMQISGVG